MRIPLCAGHPRPFEIRSGRHHGSAGAGIPRNRAAIPRTSPTSWRNRTHGPHEYVGRSAHRNGLAIARSPSHLCRIVATRPTKSNSSSPVDHGRCRVSLMRGFPAPANGIALVPDRHSAREGGHTPPRPLLDAPEGRLRRPGPRRARVGTLGYGFGGADDALALML